MPSLTECEGQVADAFGHSSGAKIETLSVTSRSDAIAPLECPTKYICALEADRSRHALDILVWHRQTLPGFVQSQAFNERGGCGAETLFETAASLAA